MDMKRQLGWVVAALLACGYGTSASAQTLPPYMAPISGKTSSTASDVASKDVLALNTMMFELYGDAAKIEAIRKSIDKTGRDVRLEVDGGVDAVIARQCVDAGADVLVAGTAAFKGGPQHYAANIAALKGEG